MQAIVQDRYGSADTLAVARTDRPAIGDRDVLVRVYAAGIGAGDRHLMTGEPYLLRLFAGLRAPRARTPGQTVAGRVEAIGKDVTRHRLGDEVFGTCSGAFAEYASVREDRLVPKPANVTFLQAASAPDSAVTALMALREVGKLQSGQNVLVIGASGGVGTFAVQIAKSLGAEVTGVCSTSKLDLVRSIGADRVIDYTREDITEGGDRYDLIIDIAGNRSLSRLRRILRPEGTLVITGGEGSGKWVGMSRQLRSALLSPFVRQRLRFFVASVSVERLQFIADLMGAGKVTPIVDRTYPLSETADAMRYFESGRARGKVAIQVRACDD
jgi:NADPH:quinone reductase-like Zn-dependent oxidoreductase